MYAYVVSLHRLYRRHDACSDGTIKGDSAAAFAAIVARLAENLQLAEACGWTQCVLERPGGLGRLRLAGVPPDGDACVEVPDLVRGRGGAEADYDHFIIAHAHP